MNKSELVDAVSVASGLSKVDTERAVKGFLNVITKTLSEVDEKGENKSVTLIGFGTFLVRERKKRVGRNPRTGEPINIAASKIPAFKAGKAFKDAVN